MDILNSGQKIIDILKDNGYPVKYNGLYFSFPAKWRDGTDESSVTYYPCDNHCIDWVTAEHFTSRELISKVLGLKTEDERNNAVEKYSIKGDINPQPEIKQIKVFPDSVVTELIPEYSYWLNRGISEDILRETKGGLYSGDKGAMKNRFVFPVFNSKNQVIMLSGRDVSNNDKRPKWLHRGTKQNVYPAFINGKYIQEKKSVFILESPGDFLSLASCGIRNTLVMFGTELNLSILNYLLKININKIYISPNNDHLTNNAGNDASKKIYKKLSRYFSPNQLQIVLVQNHKDWNDCLLNAGKQEILEQLKEYIN